MPLKSIRLKSIITYIVTFLVAFGLLFYLFKDQELGEMLTKLEQVEYRWIFLSIGLSLVSHLARAYRWNLLMKPLGYTPPVGKTFLAVMTGYVTNLLFPRMGEVSRCGVLNRMENIPVSNSFGTVVAERIFDFFVLLSLIGLAVIVEFDKLFGLLSSMGTYLFGLASRYAGILYALSAASMVFLLTAIFLIRKYKGHLTQLSLYQKIRSFSGELIKGLSSFRKIENKAGFWLSTLTIWCTYYLMSYVIVFAVPETQHLSMWAGLSVLVMGGLGMAAPVQGGIGTYHAMVSSVLLLYGIAQQDGIMFATLLHSSQTISVLFFGGSSFILSLIISSRAKKKEVHA